MTRYLVGIDIGTMGTKAGIYGEQGELAGTAYEASKLYYPRPGWVEQRDDEIHGSAVRSIRAALDQRGISPKDVFGIAFDGQMAGVSTVGLACCSPINYDPRLDTRCAAYLQR